VLFKIANRYGYYRELVTRLVGCDSLLWPYVKTLTFPEEALKIFLLLDHTENIKQISELFKANNMFAQLSKLIEEDRARKSLFSTLNLSGKSMVDHLLSDEGGSGGNSNANLISYSSENVRNSSYFTSNNLPQLIFYLSKQQDTDLWEYAVEKSEKILEYILQDEVFLLSVSVQEFSVLLKFLMKTENQNREKLIKLLQRILLGVVLHPFKNHPSLQTMLITSILKSSKPERLSELLPALNYFDGRETVSMAIRLGHLEEALQIAKQLKEHLLGIEILVNHMDDMVRAFDFANTVDEPEVWKFVGKAQWRKNNLKIKS